MLHIRPGTIGQSNIKTHDNLKMCLPMKQWRLSSAIFHYNLLLPEFHRTFGRLLLPAVLQLNCQKNLENSYSKKLYLPLNRVVSNQNRIAVRFLIHLEDLKTLRTWGSTHTVCPPNDSGFWWVILGDLNRCTRWAPTSYHWSYNLLYSLPPL